MPRNSSGSMAPANGPYISGTTISTVAVNARFSDIENEITDSASRSGKGGFTAPLRTADGSVAAPAHSFTGEPSDGMYRAGTGDVRLAVGGVDALKLVAGGVNGPLALATGTTSVQVTVSGGFLLLQGNRVAADITLADVVADSSVTRTAGNLFGVRNNGTAKLLVDYQGLLSLASQAAPIQPASLVTAITPNAGITAGGGLGFWKDATGLVRLKGSMTNAGAATTTWVTTTPLPVGYRPSAKRTFSVAQQSGGTNTINVNADGTITTDSLETTGIVNFLDGIAFLAEQ